jgi:hypothetical protein
MDVIAVAILLGILLYFYGQYGEEWRRKFWLYMAEHNPYYKVAKDVSLTSSALRKYANDAMVKKLLELEAKVQKYQAQLSEIQQKMSAQKEASEVIDEQIDEKVKEVLKKEILLKPTVPIRVIDADGVVRGWLDSIRGTFSEAYILVRTPDNLLLIFGPDDLSSMILN